MMLLAEGVTVTPRFARSANLERDGAHADTLDGYVVTSRGADMVRRVAATAADTPAGGAWSITGPYGSGKSSLALLLDAAFGPAGERRNAALSLIAAADAPTATLVDRAHTTQQTTRSGFARGLVTARREPLAATLARAVAAAGAPLPAPRQGSEPDPPDPATILAAAKGVAQHRPVLLIIDEFGKNLEAARDDAASDPYLLQQLAEAGQGAGLPIFLLTLQHLSFGDYMTDFAGPARTEWAKVQGRFEDVTYLESPSQTRALIGAAFDVHDPALRTRVARWARSEAATLRRLGITDMADTATVADCYPLSPLAALVLPEMCNRYGQHERTLFSFLTGPGAATAATFVANTELPERGRLPTVGADAVYDFFAASGAFSGAAAGRASRLTEIATRLRDTAGLTSQQSAVAKTVAVLNMTSAGGRLRASAALVGTVSRHSTRILSELEEIGLLTYRNFADEYRIWQGSDIDIGGLLDAHAAEAATRDAATLLADIDPLAPQVAARHSVEHDTLRVFARRYASPLTVPAPPGPGSPYDGEMLVLIADDAEQQPHIDPPCLADITPATKPVVAAIPGDTTRLIAAARHAAAAEAALKDPTVDSDRVARSELAERVAFARSELHAARVEALAAATCRWTLLTAGAHIDLPAGRGSAALSAACSHAYPHTAPVRNEILNRTVLTSQGAGARRLLLGAMIERGTETDLSFEGFGPEVAMYRSFLERSGLHAPQIGDTMAFTRPTDPRMVPAWDAMVDQMLAATHRRLCFADILDALTAPPFGMKAGAASVLATAGLLALRDQVAIYEHGTFKPALTADMSERMVRNPGHFDIKHFAHAAGGRRQIVDALTVTQTADTKRSDPLSSVVAAVSRLVGAVRRLDNYTLRTTNLPEHVRAVRDTLLTATEPDILIFTDLPEAVGYPSAAPGCDDYPEAAAYADSLNAAFGQLSGALDGLLNEIHDQVIALSGHTGRRTLSAFADILDGAVIDRDVAAFVGALGASDSAERAWAATIATVVARKAPAEWSDTDRARFAEDLPSRLAAFNRLVALHADRHANEGPFTTMRVAFTRPDGTEYVRLLATNDDHARHVDGIVDAAIREIAATTGSQISAAHTLLTSTASRLMGESASADETRADTVTAEQTGPADGR